MILQEIQFPRIGEHDTNLYMRDEHNKVTVDVINKMSHIKAGARYKFDTYFNTFSLEKWVKYTILDDLYLEIEFEGVADLVIYRIEHYSRGLHYSKYPIHAERISSNRREKYVFKVPRTNTKGILSFEIHTVDSSIFYGGTWSTGEVNQEEVNIALCICTFKREDYLIPNMKMLEEDMPSYLKIYIVDNGGTLSSDDFSNSNIKLIPNKNSGGAGGFTRGMLEALAEKDKHNLTNILLMDDDVVFTKHTLDRTYAFLKMLKPEWRNIMLGGAMLNLDDPVIQHAAGENWTLNGIHKNKCGLNLAYLSEVVKNEIEDSVNLLGWWYCCFSLDETLSNNLSLPVFFQGDDQDFSLRNSHWHKVNLNGICLWHESFEKKRSASKDYFWNRNFFITSSIHSNDFTKKFLLRFLAKNVISQLFLYRYKEANLILKGAEDFLKGLEWLGKQDPIELNKEIMGLVEKSKPLNELEFVFNRHMLEASQHSIESRKQRLIRRISLNGWLMRSRGESVVPAIDPIRIHTFRKSRVLNYDQGSNTGYVTYKSYKQAFAVICNFIRLAVLVNRNFGRTIKANKLSYKNVINKDFWQNYLA